jgi:anaerobic magnesium-protoporphyrin IX monomethyl ester cyclase
MKYALVNPPWSFDGSIYFGCRDSHLPLEFGYSRTLLERERHDVLLLDGQLDGLTLEAMHQALAAFQPDFLVVTTAPSYLFWRCAPPELRVPLETVRRLRETARTLVIVGPHASTTPSATLGKLAADVVILGECEEILPLLAAGRAHWRGIPSIAWREGREMRIQGVPHASNMAELPPLHWPQASLQRHRHHHHRFDRVPAGPGAEMEVSRGCPYHCSFCAKENFRSQYRKRPLAVILDEVEGLLDAGVEYVYFIDEIFLPDRALLEALRERAVVFGVQTRIDLWTRDMLDLLGAAGCVSIEAGVESISIEGRNLLDKASRLSTEEITNRLVHARGNVPFVQANLLEAKVDDPRAIDAWRQHLHALGVWANRPVPLFPYPGSPDYTKRWGAPDDRAWERAHQHYLREYAEFSDIQEAHPVPLAILESHAAAAH